MRGGWYGFLRTKTQVLWPHELFSAIYNFHPTAFVRFILGGGQEVVRNFWRRMPTRRGLRSRVGWDQWCVPLGLHGDGVAISNIRGAGQKVLDTLSWSSLLSTAPTRYSSYLIYFCFSHIQKKGGFANTWRAFWKKLARSFQILYSGVWPETTLEGAPEPRSGTPLAGGFWGVLYVNKGDLDWMSGHFNLAHSSSRYPCALCGCSNLGSGRDVYPWTDVRDVPTWEETCWTDEAS